MAYRNNSNKVWTGILAVLLVLVIAGTAALVGVLSDGFKNWDKFKSDEEQTEQTEETANGGTIIGESEGENVKVKSMRIAPEDYAAYGVSPMAETAYTLTATVLPDNEAENTGIDWSVAWANAESEWASGKTVTDYVTITPQGDTAALSKKATVECLQEFAEQIIITATSVDNGEASATCTVDYAQKIESITLKFGEMNVNLGGETSVTWEVNPNGTGMGGAVTVDYALSDVYTVADTFDYTVTLDDDNWDLAFFFTSAVPVTAVLTETDITDGSMVFDNAMFSTYQMYYTHGGQTPLSSQHPADLYGYFSGNDLAGNNIFGVTVTVTGTYGELSQRSQLTVSGATNTSTITDVTLDEDSVIF